MVAAGKLVDEAQVEFEPIPGYTPPKLKKGWMSIMDTDKEVEEYNKQAECNSVVTIDRVAI